MAALVQTEKLAELVELWLETHQLKDLQPVYGYKTVDQAAREVLKRKKAQSTLWRADALCTSMGRPEWLQLLQD